MKRVAAVRTQGGYESGASDESATSVLLGYEELAGMKSGAGMKSRPGMNAATRFNQSAALPVAEHKTVRR